MSNKLVIYPPEQAYKNENLVFYNSLIKQKTNSKILNLSNFNIAKCYGLEETIIKDDVEYLEKVYNKFIKILTNELNIFHSENKTERYWSIILGKWLGQLINTSYNRYQTLEKIFKEFDIKDIEAIDYSKIIVADECTDCFENLVNDVLFDAILVSKIVNFSKYKIKISKNLKISKKIFFINQNPKSNEESIKFKAKKKIKNLFKLFNLFKKSDDAFINDTYLPFLEEKKLQMKVNKLPRNWDPPNFNYSKYDQEKRDLLKFDLSLDNEFESILLKIIKDYLPIAALESYKKLILFIEQLPWPTNPKFILTANNFSGNDIYKFWIADKVEKGSPYFVIQHGIGYLESMDKKTKIEFKTADKFFSWGNFSYDKKIIPLFNLTLCGKKKINKTGDKLIFLQKSRGNKVFAWDRFGAGEFLAKNMVYLLENLSMKIKKNTILRLHPNWTEKTTYIEIIDFLKKNSLVEIDLNTKYLKLIKKAKLIICDDLTSGFLQNLSLNCPTICYLPFGPNTIHDENKKDYIELMNKKIIFKDVKEMINHIELIWDDIDKWWNEKNLKSVRDEFCSKYSIYPPKDAVKKFSKLLIKNT